MARSKRKRCKVYIEKDDNDNYPSRYRCENKIKPGTPFCAEHFETHKLIEMKCTGENHPYGDHCMICAPFWGHYPVAVPKDAPGTPWESEWE